MSAIYTIEEQLLDLWIAENLMDWKRIELTNQELNREWTGEYGSKMYLLGKKTIWLLSPETDVNMPGGVPARYMIGDVTIGGIRDLPRFTSEKSSAFDVLEKLSDGNDIAVVKTDGKFKSFRLRDIEIGNQKWFVMADTLPLAICFLAKKIHSK